MRQVLSDMRASGVPDKYLKGLEDYAEVGVPDSCAASELKSDATVHKL
jgi:hypothetical protein